MFLVEREEKSMKAEAVRDFFINGGKIIGNLAISLYGKTLDVAGENAFADAIEIGITNSITALYNADVKDEVILREMAAVWGISKDEAIDRLLIVKGNCAIEALKQHLRLQGWDDAEIRHFMISTHAAHTIRNNHDLWKLKNSPDKLYKAITDKKK